MKSIGLLKKVSPILLFFFLNNALGQTMYHPNESLRNTIRKDLWQGLKLKTPKKHRFLSSLVFNSNECFKLFEKAAKQRGWESYELPTVAAFYQIVLEEVIAGELYPEAEIKTIYQQVRADYANQKIDVNESSTALQKKYDPLIVKAVWVGTIFELAKKNSLEIQETAKAMLEEFKGFHKSAASIDKTNIEKDKPTGSKPKMVSPGPSTMPNKKNDDYVVSDIILRTTTKYGLNGVYVDNEVHVLYRNGELFTNPSEPLHSFNISKSKREKPKKWRTWKKKDNVLYVYDPRKHKTYDWKKWFKVRSGTEGFKLSGKFNTIDGFGGATVINASTVVFDEQGRFAWKTIKGGNTAWKPVFSKSSSSGTYQINGHTIIFTYNNGVEESFFFGLYPKDDLHFIIGTSHFVPLKK